MTQFNSRISAARRNAEAMLNRSKKPDSTLKVEQEKEHGFLSKPYLTDKLAKVVAAQLAKAA